MAIVPPTGMFAGDEIGEFDSPNGVVMLPASVGMNLGLKRREAMPNDPTGNPLGPMATSRAPMPMIEPPIAPQAMPAPAPTGPTAPKPGAAPTAPAKAAAAPQDARRPMTSSKDLTNIGIGGALDLQLDANNEAIQANDTRTESEASQLIKIADERDEGNRRTDKILAERARKAEEDQRLIGATVTEYEAAAKKYADKKIDRSVDHPILAAISLALGAIGSAMQNKGENPALDILMKQIDRKVAGQMSDREHLGQVAAGKRNDVALLRDRATDRTSQYNLMLAGEYERTAKHIDAITARSGSDIIRAKGMETSAALKAQAANFVGTAAMATIAENARAEERAEQRRHARAQEGLQAAGLAQSARFHADDVKFRDKQFEYGIERDRAQLDMEAAKLAQAGRGKAGELIRETGIGGMATPQVDKDGNTVGVDYKPIVNKDGSTFIAPTKEEAIALRKKKAAVDSIVSMLDETARLRAKYGWSSDLVRSKEWQEMKANWSALTLENKEFHNLGAIAAADKTLIDDYLGTADPTQTKDPLPGIAQSRKNVLRGFNNTMRSQGYTGDDYSPVNTSTLSSTPNEVNQAYQDVSAINTVQETANKERNVGAGRKALEYVTGGGILYNNADERATATENRGSTKYPYGFAPGADAQLDTLLASYRGGNPAAKKDARQRLLDLAANDRPDLKAAGINLLRNEAPDLYKETVAKLPKEEREAVEGFDNMRAQNGSIGDLEKRAMTDDAAMKQLVDLVSAGNKDAIAAAQRVVRARGVK